jgi:hypothetical protein
MFYSINPLKGILNIVCEFCDYFLDLKMYLLPLEGVRGEEPSLWEGLGRL